MPRTRPAAHLLAFLCRRSARAHTVAALLGALLAVAAISSAAQAAAPVWRILAQTNTTIAPGGTSNFRIEAKNVGDAGTDGSLMAFTATMPSGLRVTAASVLDQSGSGWRCFTSGLPARTLTCSNSTDVVPPRGRVLLQISVQADSLPNGTVRTGSFAITGGGAASSSTVAPVTISSTEPGFGVSALDGETTNADGGLARTAGAHPYATAVALGINTVHDPAPLVGDLWPVEPLKDVVTDLPPGLVGNPTGIAQCTASELANSVGTGALPLCDPNSQVGTVEIHFNGAEALFDAIGPLPVFNMVPPPGVPARFGFNALGVVVTLDAKVRSGSDYGISVVVANTTEAIPLASTIVTFWGVPADASHDPQRSCRGQSPPWDGGPSCTSTADRTAFLRNPTSCIASPGSPVQDGLVTTMHADSWTHPARFGADGLPDLTDPAWKSASFVTHDAPGFPYAPQDWGPHYLLRDCDAVPFDPTLDGQPSAGAKPMDPTGFAFDVQIPQSNDPLETAQSDLRRAVVTLPAGLRVSPSSVNGRTACSSAQIALHNGLEPTCPDASKVGTVRIDTPLLPDPLDGSVYLAAQGDNPFGSLLAIYIVAHGPGVVVKLAGHVEPDPITGQLTTTFDDNPQVPFSRLHLEFDGGDRAPLVLPDQCGIYTTTATMTGWNGRTVPITSSFTLSGDAAECAGRTTFTPVMKAGTERPTAGVDSAFHLRLTRGDHEQQLKALTVEMPPGLTGRIANVDLCPEAQASAGTCPDGSRIGSVTVGAGPGSDPIYVSGGRAYLTGPYKGAPFGLSIVVPAKAGPFDLGNVNVRSALFVDKHTASVRVVSDPLPTILQGIPLDVRDVRVSVDREHFFVNPTGCEEKTINGTIESTAGATAHVTSRFQASRCGRLPFWPKMRLAVGGRKHVRKGQTTPLSTTVTMPQGNANLRSVSVVLPRTINARLTVIQDACTRAEFESDISKCAHSKAGVARAVTPLLRDPLRGGAYFVKNGHPIPDLFIALRGQVDFDLIGEVSIPGGTHLATTFDAAPDVAIRSFSLRLFGDSTNGSIGAAANLCSKRGKRAKAQLVFKAQNGRELRRSQRLLIHGCPKSVKAKRGKGASHRGR